MVEESRVLVQFCTGKQKDYSMKTKIYVLVDPRNDKIRYLGKTVQPLKQRLDTHLKETLS